MNAKTELVNIITINGLTPSDILWAKITTNPDYQYWGEDDFDDFRYKELILKEGYSDEELQHFLNALDVEYNDGLGSHELYGIVAMKDNTWLERHEYDGVEWWEFKKFPNIPDECK